MALNAFKNLLVLFLLVCEYSNLNVKEDKGNGSIKLISNSVDPHFKCDIQIIDIFHAFSSDNEFDTFL